MHSQSIRARHPRPAVQYNWLLVVRLGLGLDGAALAVVALQLSCVAMLGGCVVARCIRQAVPLPGQPAV